MNLLKLAHRLWPSLLAAAALLVMLPGAGTARGSATVTTLDWPAYGRTPDIANTVPAGLDVGSATKLHARWTRKLNGSVIAQPLYLAHAAVTGGTRPLLFVVTGANTVFALDAQGRDCVGALPRRSGAAGVRWHIRHLLDAGALG